MPTAILSGDNMLVKAFELLINYTGPNKDEILKAFTKTAAEVCEGQQNDMDFESMEHVDIHLYLKMIQCKTAVLLGCSLKCGALSANCDIETSNVFYDFAINMGMAFQLMDDYLDTFGKSESTGKIQGGDIIQGKKTWLFLKSKESDEAKHNELFSISDVTEKTSKTIQFWQEIGIDNECLQLIQSYNSKAQIDLKTLESRGFSCEILLELLDYLGSRQH
jgi:geranylgeranyl diphosphate synthase type II